MKSQATTTETVPGREIGGADGGAHPSLGSSSFYAGMRVLPAPQRQAMFEIYRFCRAVDDIADGLGDRTSRLADLARWRGDIYALYAGAPPNHLRALLDPTRTFDLQCDDFLSVIDGVEMDVTTDMRAPDLATLDLYCDRVACAVGRLSIRVFGMSASKGKELASHLGRALQLTNILRDLDEDAEKGRLYLPREMLLAAGIDETDPKAALDHPALGIACRELAERVGQLFAAAEKLMGAERPRVVRAPRLMALVYEDTLQQLVERGWAPPRSPVRVGRGKLLWIVLRHGLLH